MLYSKAHLHRQAPVKMHEWVTIPNPTNLSALLQACDHCGVVKSQNTMIKRCSADSDQFILSRLTGL